MYWFRLKVLTLGAIFGVTPYIVTNQFSIHLPPNHLASDLDTVFPLWPATVFVYIAIYVMVIIPLIMVENKTLLKNMVIGFILMQYIAAAIFILFPVHYPREMIPAITNFSEYAMATIHKIDKPGNCFPSLHVANAAYCAFITQKVNRPAGAIAMALFLLISFSTLTTKQHYIADIIAGVILAYIFYLIFFKNKLRQLDKNSQISNKFSHMVYFFLVYSLMVLFFLVGYTMPI